MYESFHTFMIRLPEAADLFTFPAALSPFALAPFGLCMVIAAVLGLLARRSVDVRSPEVQRNREVRPDDAPRTRDSAPPRNHSSAWISRTGGIVRL